MLIQVKDGVTPKQGFLNGSRNGWKYGSGPVGKQIGQTEPHSMVAFQVTQLVGKDSLHSHAVSYHGLINDNLLIGPIEF